MATEMVKEEEKKVDTSKADEGGGSEPLDKVLKKLDALHGRMDAMELSAGSKNPLKSDKRKDARKDDDDDDDEEEEKKKEEHKDDDDGGEEEIKKEEGKEKAPPLIADKRKDVKKDAKKDATKSDDDDDEEEEGKAPPFEKKEDSRADSFNVMQKQISDQAAEIARLSALMKPRSDDEHAAFADVQAKADSVFAGFGKRAPRPLEGENLISYRKRLATMLKPHSPTWKNVKFSQLPDPAFDIAEATVYADAESAASSPTDLEDGVLRPVTSIDPDTGMRTTKFYGSQSFVKHMGRAGRHVRRQESGGFFRTTYPQ